MKVSVIMSVYNGAKHVKASIESILNQTYEDFEFIIIDDSSKDKTLKIIEEYAKRDKRIKILKNKFNLGLTKSLNKAIINSRGIYIARQDADDTSLPNRLEEQIYFLNANPDYAFCGTNGKRLQTGSDILLYFGLDKIRKVLILKNCFSHPSIVIRKKILCKYGLYDENFRYSQDYELWCRLVYKYNLKCKNLNQNLIIRSIPTKRFQTNKKVFSQKLNTIRIQTKYLHFTKLTLYFFLSLILNIIELIFIIRLASYYEKFLKKIGF
ncbi:hypothetical protein LCGC14_1918230 [marine sediment metagenome]|uniref:Glycosyltransferase 2-like domain-containing protein n=1 Tax=marine sediment metagenome TaxID=412755 RepID=A0A0F9I5J7_9ZZZZ